MTAQSSHKKAVHFGAGNIGKCSHGPQGRFYPCFSPLSEALFLDVQSNRLANRAEIARLKNTSLTEEPYSRPWLRCLLPAQLRI